MPTAVVLEWNGRDVPEQLRDLPAGRYILVRVDDVVELSPKEEAGLLTALKTAENEVLSHDGVMNGARRLLGGLPREIR